MSILEICQWLQNLGWATSIRESIMMFPVLEGSHLLGIAVMLAPTFLLDIRLLGWGWKGDSVGKIAYSFLPVTFFGGGLVPGSIVLIGGVEIDHRHASFEHLGRITKRLGCRRIEAVEERR